MPRGNDTDQALKEVRERYGDGAGNAEELIQAVRGQYDKELRATLLMDPDEENAPDKAEVAKATGLKKEQIRAATYRGEDRVSFVAEGEDGRSYKGWFPREELGRKGKHAQDAQVADASVNPLERRNRADAAERADWHSTESAEERGRTEGKKKD